MDMANTLVHQPVSKDDWANLRITVASEKHVGLQREDHILSYAQDRLSVTTSSHGSRQVGDLDFYG